MKIFPERVCVEKLKRKESLQRPRVRTVQRQGTPADHERQRLALHGLVCALVEDAIAKTAGSATTEETTRTTRGESP